VANTELEKARAARSAESEQKRVYVKSLLTGDPKLDDRTVENLVKNKFGSGLARSAIDAVRYDLGWVWEKEPGRRSRVLVRSEAHAASVGAQATTTRGEPVAVNANAPQADRETERKLREFATDDEKREVELINELQSLMQRQGYREITIPASGQAHIRLFVVREKLPGEHVDAQIAH
jgi:hypothetical protein